MRYKVKEKEIYLPNTKQNKRLTVKIVQWQATEKGISPSILATFST